MINTELLSRVRYPDENDGLYFDIAPYDKIVEYLQYSIKISDEKNKKYYQENLDELERRWKERQAKAKLTEIPKRKLGNTVSVRRKKFENT